MPRLTTMLMDWAALNTDAGPLTPRAYADALVLGCQGLAHEVLRHLPAPPDEAAEGVASAPFADRAEGVFLPWVWFESYSAGVGLPVAELETGWDVSDGEDVYWCPRVTLADDPDSPQDTRPFMRLDEVRRTSQLA